MAANKQPIYSRVPDIQWIDAVATANTDKEGDAGTVYIVFTADATEGGRADKIVFMPKGTNVATVARIFINNGSATTTAANNFYYKDVTLAATTNSEVAEIGATEIPLDIPLPAGYRIFVTLGTTVAAGFMVGVLGSKY